MVSALIEVWRLFFGICLHKRMMEVLVVGSEGFIGKALTEFLKKDPAFAVLGCDVLNICKRNYVYIEAMGNFQEVFRANTFDLCINASGSAKVPYSLAEPLGDYQLNTYNVFYLLDCIRRYNPKCKFVNLSSAAVYGNPQSNPIVESHRMAPISPYGWNKYQSELICQEFTNVYGISTCSLRVFSVYGEGLKKQLFWDLYEKANKGSNITLFGTGNESRDFIYIHDLLNVIKVVALEAKFKGEALNVANGEEIFIEDSVKLFLKFLGWEGECTFSGEERKGDPANWCADIKKIEQMGYKRKVRFDEGVKQYVEWLKK